MWVISLQPTPTKCNFWTRLVKQLLSVSDATTDMWWYYCSTDSSADTTWVLMVSK